MPTNNQGNILPQEPSYPTTGRPEYCNTTEAQEKDLKRNFMKMIDILKEGVNKSLKEIVEKANKK